MISWLRNSAAGLLLLASCSGPRDRVIEKITVRLSADSTKIEIRGLDHALTDGLLADSAANETWQSLLPVFKESKDPELRGIEPYYPGKYVISGDLLTYTPDTAFAKNTIYRAELNLPDPVTNDQVTGRDAPPGRSAPKEFRFGF